ncbi:MAG: hypothetical protein JSR43_01700 [Proteobacteria bacterium]|nr:hypothetical protein [Pseudomonadota bacterium]
MTTRVFAVAPSRNPRTRLLPWASIPKARGITPSAKWMPSIIVTGGSSPAMEPDGHC